ncbi:Putative beta-barrel porin-2, OmpL-like. bbp2 [Nitrosomonas aestuarii]|uniref:Putative beta-barrel porin-2, OmpL-like. bbp2 n=1 Tax=Nitrosomonas aestuarii TaxID=52441 RepID=A0A1I4GHN1_9PROT|nr:porin [Nitrosomonas aestuarii]SFL29475.1 Putative beta-barrel porin-2, OmpL-like. bbp2 [Nitrosomonas aestuarii]
MRYQKWLFLAITSSVLFFDTYSVTLYADNLKNFFKHSRLELGGWINGGATFNPSQTGGYNGPVIFADQANKFQLNQFNVFLQRSVVSTGKTWEFGGRVDFMFGTDAIFTQAFGVPTYDVNSGEPLSRSNWDLNLCCSSSRTYGIALPQTYIEAYAPIGNGLNVKLGHFYTPTGFETVPAPDNFFYTRAYTLNVGEPFTHTGLLANYTVNKNWLVLGGALTGSATGGWDAGWDKQLGNWDGLAGFTWTSDNRATSFHFSGTYGETSTSSSEPWGFYNIVFKHRITPKMLLVLHHVYGFAGGVLLNNPKYNNVIKDAEWMSFITHLYYDLTDNLSVGLRGEWFRDSDGFRNPSPFRVAAATNIVNGAATSFAGNLNNVTITPADYYALTVGLNWKAAKTLKLKWNAIRKLNLRPNIRYDTVDALHTASYRPFAGNKDQIIFSLDFLLPF